MTLDTLRRLLAVPLLGLLWLAAVPAGATTYMSVEPIPNQDVVGEEVLGNLVALPFEDRELWSQLLIDCGLVQGVLDALAADGTVASVNASNTFFGVAAGGFEGQTNPTYVFTVVDSGVNAVATADVETVVNALGYVLSQGGTVHFSPDDGGAYDFPLDYVTVTFTAGPPSGSLAQTFFEHVGTVDPALFSGLFAGYTQIGAALLFLQPAVGVQQFTDGMFAAAQSFPNVAYAPFDGMGDPTTAPAGVAFRGNDWSANPGGSEYLAGIAQDPDADLGGIRNLNELRALHLGAVAVLDELAAEGEVDELTEIRSCAELFGQDEDDDDSDSDSDSDSD